MIIGLVVARLDNANKKEELQHRRELIASVESNLGFLTPDRGKVGKENAEEEARMGEE